jgi:hypothetical protein
MGKFEGNPFLIHQIPEIVQFLKKPCPKARRGDDGRFAAFNEDVLDLNRQTGGGDAFLGLGLG